MQKYRRQIFYLSGFDPRGASFYHALYRSELEKFARLADRPRPTVSSRSVSHGYRSDWRIETEDCNADFAFLHWDDLVRQRWRRSKSEFAWNVVKTYVSFVTGARAREALRLAPVVGRTFYFPLALVAVPLLMASLLAAAWGPPFLLSFPLLIGLAWLLFRHWQPGWLLHIFSFNQELCAADHPDLDRRCDLHALHVGTALKSGLHDEVLLVGHSNGCALVLMVLDRLVAQGLAGAPQLKILTLAQLTQMVSLHKRGVAMRQTLQRLSDLPRPWLDVSAKADPACFALVGPFAPVAEAPKFLAIASARLHRLYAPSAYRRLKADKFNFHFLYLKCGDRLGAYNYPRLTAYAGPLETHIAAIEEDARA